jgi:N-acetylmuramoyl-L-alanine amidase
MVEASGLGAHDFLPWNTAQGAFVAESSTAAGFVATELENRNLPHTLLAAPLSPMNHIAAPALALEIASPTDNVRDIAGAKYLDQVAQSIASGIAASRGKPAEVRR